MHIVYIAHYAYCIEGEKMIDKKNTDARIKANNRYNAKTYDQLRCNYRKEERLNELVELAAEKHNISKAEYMLTAIRFKLESDGVTIDQLHPIDN